MSHDEALLRMWKLVEHVDPTFAWPININKCSNICPEAGSLVAPVVRSTEQPRNPVTRPCKHLVAFGAASTTIMRHQVRVLLLGVQGCFPTLFAVDIAGNLPLCPPSVAF